MKKRNTSLGDVQNMALTEQISYKKLNKLHSKNWTSQFCEYIEFFNLNLSKLKCIENYIQPLSFQTISSQPQSTKTKRSRYMNSDYFNSLEDKFRLISTIHQI